MSIQALISYLLYFHNQLKVYHWTCSPKSVHESFGECYDGITNLIDSIVEETISNNFEFVTDFRSSDQSDSFVVIKLKNFKKENILDKLEEDVEKLKEFRSVYEKTKYTNIVNKFDELLSEVSKLQYQLQLDLK